MVTFQKSGFTRKPSGKYMACILLKFLNPAARKAVMSYTIILDLECCATVSTSALTLVAVMLCNEDGSSRRTSLVERANDVKEPSVSAKKY